MILLQDITPYWQDILAVLFFIGSWWSYAHYADNLSQGNLLSATNRYRLMWMHEMMRRDNRSIDAITMGNLTRSITFFASTTIFILLGLMTMLGYHEKLTKILEAVPFTQPAPEFLWEAKIFLLIILFIYSFFKYTWSMRQYNYAGILVGAAPPHNERVSEHAEFAERTARLVSNAARHFNKGLRAYYFGLATLAWFVHPLLFMLATAWVVFVTHRREFRSTTLSALS